MGTTSEILEAPCQEHRLVPESGPTTINHGGYEGFWAASGTLGIVVEDDRIGGNPINNRDPSGLMGIGAVGTNLFVDYPYKALPGATFVGWIDAGPKNIGHAHAHITFNLPRDWRNPDNCQATSVKIIQVLMHYEADASFGFTKHKESNWTLDDYIPGTGSTFPFYAGSSSWWDISQKALYASIDDGPGASAGYFSYYHMRMDFRDYAIATSGKDAGKSYGYIDWGFEWINGNPSSETVWIGQAAPGGKPHDGGTLGQLLHAETPKTGLAPLPGGVSFNLLSQAAPI